MRDSAGHEATGVAGYEGLNLALMGSRWDGREFVQSRQCQWYNVNAVTRWLTNVPY